MKKLNELKQTQRASGFPGSILHGSGKVFEVGTCGFLDESEKYGSDCLKVVLDKGSPRVVLYFGENKRSEIAELSVGSRYSFDNCVATSVKDWGAWATATCDMP